MATRFSHTGRIDAPVETVFNTYGDEAYWHDRLTSVGTDDDTLDEFSTSDDSITVTITQHIPDEDIPDIARKVLPGRLVVVRTSIYTGFDGERFSGTARADAAGGLGEIHGSAEAVGEAAAVTESVSGRVKVAVPLLGSRLEKLVIAHLTTLFEAEYEHLNRWTAAR